MDYIIDFNRIIFTCLCFSVLFINIFIYLHIFFIIIFLFIVILPVFFCEIIQSHLLYVRCPAEGFSLFSFFLFFFFFFFFWKRGGGGLGGRTARYIDLNIVSQDR